MGNEIATLRETGQFLKREQTKTFIMKAANRSLLGQHDSEYIISSSLLYIDRSPQRDKILRCGNVEIMKAIGQAVGKGLIPDGIECALVPYGRNLTLIPMYQGKIKMLIISGAVQKIEAEAVYEKDDFRCNLSNVDDPIECHKMPALNEDRGEVIGAWARATLPNGSRLSRVVTLKEIIAARAKSASYKNGGKGPWKDDFAAMASKTAIHRLSKLIPATTEAQKEALSVMDDDLIEDVEFEESPQPTTTEELFSDETEREPGEEQS